MTAAVRIVTAGDSAVCVEFEPRIDTEVNRRVVAVARAIEAARLPGVRDVVPAYRSVGVHFDPLHTEYDALVRRIVDEAEHVAADPPDARALRRVPVCYEGDFAPDLEGVSARSGLSVADVVALHAAPIYRVFMLGFMPGFAYMGTVDDRIAAPRLATPRLQVPAGSVGLAGSQTGIYPSESPGGWQIIGRTPIVPFDETRADPFLFAPGDLVQFYAIDRGEYERQRAGA